VSGDLFGDAPPGSAPESAPEAATPADDSAPLAERLRPRHLDEVIGQAHLLGPGRPLRRAWESGQLPSLILWGPPGVGKTTLARLLAQASGAHFIVLSAVLAGVKDIRDAVEQARAQRAAGRRSVVFVDEVHRFNKAQQDAFLPHVESGLFAFIGATTENPSFEVNSALLSRASVFVLEALDEADLRALVERGRAALTAPELTEGALAALVAHADGDGRRLLNALENVVAAAGPVERIDEVLLERTLAGTLRRGDKGGDIFYDLISALHKSVRASQPDATLYWLARMLDAGIDARYVARRLVRMASEDIGLADPRALAVTQDAAMAWERMGSPEGDLALAEAAVYLAVAPKSNAVYKAFGAARAAVAQHGTLPVPMHLRNAPTKLMKQLGHGAGYRYAHDEADGYSAGFACLPAALTGVLWYQPTDRGLEARIAEKLAGWRARDAQQEGPAEAGSSG
jgi:putative ATPase